MSVLFVLHLLLIPSIAEDAVKTPTKCGHVKELFKKSGCCKKAGGHDDMDVAYQIVPDPEHRLLSGKTNPCKDKNPGIPSKACFVDNVINSAEQAGADVTEDYWGTNNYKDTEGVMPITSGYWKTELCPVNVHWHLGAEHRSKGQYDENGDGPLKKGHPSRQEPGRRMSGDVRYGYACHHYKDLSSEQLKPYMWKHCEGMYVGETYEVHWPHSALGACGTPWQYQEPFKDGVFCNYDGSELAPQTIASNVGVQAQVFVIVNDEHYYYPNLMRGMIVNGEFAQNVAVYVGSTTGTSVNNELCSGYTPITWQVDRKCHLISASSFDKMCADMKQQADDMSTDLEAHGARELVFRNLTYSATMTTGSGVNWQPNVS
jgi:hypothetical protein